MGDWRDKALRSLRDARDEIEAAQEPTIVIVLTIAQADLFKERPISLYANQTWDWLHKVLCFAAWRTSLKSGPMGATDLETEDKP